MNTGTIRSRAALTAVVAMGVAARGGSAAAPAPQSVDRLVRHAEAFAKAAPRAISRETLIQRSYGYPPHRRLAIGRAAEPLRARYRTHEIISEYRIGTLNGDSSAALLEFREVLSMDGNTMRTPEAARKAMEEMASGDPAQTRKRILGVFSKLGLDDVASDFGQILLTFTRQGLRDLELEDSRDEWVGADEARVWKWRQSAGGALEFRGRKTASRAMTGEVWVRNSDGAPLRVRAMFEHSEGRRRLRDEASVEYVLSKFGSAVPASVVHRHYVDNMMLTENLYLYEPFRLFTTDTRIEYTDVPPQK